MATLTPPSDTDPPADTDAGAPPPAAVDTNAAAAAPPPVADAPAAATLTAEEVAAAPPQPTTAASSDEDDDDDEGTDPGAGGVPGAPRPRKRKVALFLAYVGAGYSVSRVSGTRRGERGEESAEGGCPMPRPTATTLNPSSPPLPPLTQGMQYNKDTPTIEGVLRDAIVSAGGISTANADVFSKVGWSRAARTDKGVSAVGQVIALRMLHPVEDMAATINAHLPDAIRVFGSARVTASFDARKSCDRRRYEYILPAHAFDAGACVAKADKAEREKSRRVEGGVEGDAAAATATAADGAASEAVGTATGADAPPSETAGAGADAPPAETTAAGADASAPPAAAQADTPPTTTPFVFDDSARARLTDILSDYVGTHNFHNFSPRMAASDATANRYILSFTCEGIVDVGGEPWVRMVVLGQSFVLKQIRKMVGTAVAIARGVAPRDSIKTALRKDVDVATPMAPELGLFLDETIYAHYNAAWGDARSAPVRRDAWGDAAITFKLTRVYPHIAARDAEAGVNAEWLRSLNERNFKFSRWASMGLRPVKRTAAAAAPAPGAKRGRGRGRGGSGRGWGPPPPPEKPAVAAPSAAVAASLAAEWSD